MTSRGLFNAFQKRQDALSLDLSISLRIELILGMAVMRLSHIDGIIVSHRPRKKSQGPLHNDTAYGIVEHNETGAIVVHRVPIHRSAKWQISKRLETHLSGQPCLMKQQD